MVLNKGYAGASKSVASKVDPQPQLPSPKKNVAPTQFDNVPSSSSATHEKRQSSSVYVTSVADLESDNRNIHPTTTATAITGGHQHTPSVNAISNLEVGNQVYFKKSDGVVVIAEGMEITSSSLASSAPIKISFTVSKDLIEREMAHVSSKQIQVLFEFFFCCSNNCSSFAFQNQKYKSSTTATATTTTADGKTSQKTSKTQPQISVHHIYIYIYNIIICIKIDNHCNTFANIRTGDRRKDRKATKNDNCGEYNQKKRTTNNA
ncbi:hypothetical protein RFI_36847 [Reticulomyxa filosa]|uniref:Uncharacterized protein n=1 Tax=Reticulomyxa filosa TaxID=46433 RepID=X6LF20_RETFI|nr:hypothetical protein RFI_36847 [Reticulomyxa filosa]|eukprot:ETO00593.1 hypothetical protein RFI_36847 [Reticulomyxa filosa]